VTHPERSPVSTDPGVIAKLVDTMEELVFRPVPGLGRAETPIRALFLASASAYPGGGVRGGPGANAARAVVLHDRLRRSVDRVRRSR
jgi:phytoene dehydrogenase-like protein